MGAEAEELHRGDHAHRRGAREDVEDRHLAEPVAGAEQGHARLVTALGAAEHLDLAVEDDEEIAAGLALVEHVGARGELDPREDRDERLEDVVAEAAEEANLAQASDGGRRRRGGRKR